MAREMIRAWRMALMLKVPNMGVADLARILGDRANARSMFGHLRIGVRGVDVASSDDVRISPGIDAAIEITVPTAQIEALPRIAKEWSDALGSSLDKSSSTVVAGPIHSIIPARSGGVFYSLAFQRADNTSLAEFQTWWLNQHAGLATQLLSPDLIAYDQIHVDHTVSTNLCASVGLRPNCYDAYDNLAWRDAECYARVLENKEALRLTYEDELGHVNHATYYGSLLNVVHEK